MKMAICFFGLPRIHLPTAMNRWHEIIKLYSADVFIHTWINNDTQAYDALWSAFSPKAIIAESQIDFKKTEEDYPRKVFPNNIPNLFSQWYSYKRSVSLIKDCSYDIVIKGRYDVVPGYLDVHCNGSIHVPIDAFMMGHTHNFMPTGAPIYCVNDLIAVAQAEQMITYSQLYDNIDDLYHNCEVPMCSEMLLGAHLLRNNIPVAHRIGYSYIDGRV